MTSEDVTNIWVDLSEINLEEEEYLKERMKLLKDKLTYADPEKWSGYLHGNYVRFHNFVYTCAREYEETNEEFWILIEIS